MKTNIKFGISALLVAMLLMSMAFAEAADSSKDLQNESQLQDRKLPDFGPEVFDEMIKNSKVIQTRGNIPKIELENEKREWLHKLDQNGKSIRNQMLPYMQPEGILVSYGYNYQGYATVDILEGSEVDETLMDEIYEIFDRQAMQMGIDDVPVVFQFISPPITGEATDEGPAPDTLNMPGFTAITLLVAFLGLRRIR